MLIGERERLYRDIKVLFKETIETTSQQNYLDSLIKGLSKITRKLRVKVLQLQRDFPLIDKPFIINGKVI